METPADDAFEAGSTPSPEASGGAAYARGEIVDRLCDACGCIFRLDFTTHQGRNEVHEYGCPACSRSYRIEATEPPVVQRLSGGRDLQG